VDYRGYGRSTGKPSEAGTYRDALAAWEYLLRERRLAADKVVIMGRSLGGGVATWLAGRVAARALILESTFTSLPEVAQRLYPYVPVRWLASNRYDNLARVPRVTIPGLIIHSRDDELIPLSHGKQLFQRYGGDKEFLEIYGRHADGYLASGEVYTAGIGKFLERVVSH
jgi:pimeloyl-ACP methyl ester carboxylesterase